ncbi:hypothetical protein QZH64_23590 [Pseudomonas monachiensis]|uniref:Uncharacterized protein n=1 Tax=Pseudomonas monachiensis TaxID=3060212 RepID=A0ABW9HDK5_9PSED|nr:MULTISPECIES: hypothetical protein [unclassified Pseudomonas]
MRQFKLAAPPGFVRSATPAPAHVGVAPDALIGVERADVERQFEHLQRQQLREPNGQPGKPFSHFDGYAVRR